MGLIRRYGVVIGFGLAVIGMMIAVGISTSASHDAVRAGESAQEANDRQEQARVERLNQICSAIRDDREVLADVLSRALATSRRTPQLEGFVAETNMRLSRFPEFCADLKLNPPRVVLPPPTTTTIP